MTFRSDEDIKTVERFITKVRAMREAQKNYFRFRDGTMKAHAMTLEREVDQQLEAWEMERLIEEAPNKYPELFPAQ